MNNRRLTQIIFLATFCSLVVTQISCEPLRRKFVRKPKEDRTKKEEVVYVPQEYPEYTVSVEEMYQMYFSFWQHWHRELVDRFTTGGNKKKWLSCIEEEVKNLGLMKDIFKSQDKKDMIDMFIKQLSDLKSEIDEREISDMSRLKAKIEQLGREIHHSLTYSKVKDDLTLNK